MEIGNQIRKYRKEVNLSQDDLADRIFVSRQSISNWENNKNYPDLKSLLLMSSVFNVSLDILVNGDIETMKEKIKADINTEDIAKFKRSGTIFAVLIILLILSAVPLYMFGGIISSLVHAVIFVATMYFAISIQKEKKRLNIQTYKEILAFYEGKTLKDAEKNRE
ncbi:MAG: DNA-binding protein [Evtepia sp.]|jgi:transcriptional regulator with XRE-family HTH domain|nr:DNA-binding protein [Evtepia sp.]